MDQESYRFVKGVWMHSLFSDDAIHSAMDYKPRDGDVIVVTYPKCGTNWTTLIAHNILSRGVELSSFSEYRIKCPCIEMTGAGAALNLSRTGPILTHLPLKVFPPTDNAKYIYVARNPYDCAVSYYHFLKGVTPKRVADVSFGKFLPLFLSGKLIYGDYFDHLLPWYGRRNDANVCFLTYEQLKADTRAQVLKIADFLGEDHGAALREDECLLEKVLQTCSLEKMKLFFNETPMDIFRTALTNTCEISALSEMFKKMATKMAEMHEGSGFVRKGTVGDWRNYFTEEQIKQTKEWIERKTQGSDVMKLWKECCMP